MSETADFPLASDATNDERDAAKRDIGKYTEVKADAERAIRFAGEAVGQTGPVWHYQYTRIYKVAKGYLVAARDLHEGVKVAFAETPEKLTDQFENPVVREFIEDELRNRKLLGPAHAAH